MTPTDLAMSATECLEAWSSGDLLATRALLDDDVTFEGPMGSTTGADDYLRGVAGMAALISGVTMRRTMVDGDDVCLMYDLVSESAGLLPTVGWYHFRGDKIDSVRAYFDPRPLTEAPPPPTFRIPLFAAALQLCEVA